MKKIILVYGSIVGIVIIGSLILSLTAGFEEGHVTGLAWLGYLVMIVAFSLIFFAIKQYRDRDLGGVIRFSSALKLGLGIALLASVIYVVVWEINLAVTDFDFMNAYTESIIEQRKSEGLSETEMQEVYAEMDEMKAQYARLLPRLMITFIEIFPVGLLISLISAAILRRSEVLPAPGGTTTTE